MIPNDHPTPDPPQVPLVKVNKYAYGTEALEYTDSPWGSSVSSEPPPLNAEEYEARWGWLIPGMEIWVRRRGVWYPAIVIRPGIPPGEQFEAYGDVMDREPMRGYDDSWTVQVAIALNYNSLMVIPMRASPNLIMVRQEDDTEWRPTTPWHEERQYDSPSYSPTSWVQDPPDYYEQLSVPPRPLTDAELDMLEEYLAEMATPPPVTYTFTEAELDTILEWRMAEGRRD